MPRPCQALILSVEALAVAILVAAVLQSSDWTQASLGRAALLLAASAAVGSAARRAGDPDEDRRLLIISIDTCWMIPAALLLPLSLAAPTGAVLLTLSMLCVKRLVTPFKLVFSAARAAGGCPEFRGTWVTIRSEPYAAAPTVSGVWAVVSG